MLRKLTLFITLLVQFILFNSSLKSQPALKWAQGFGTQNFESDGGFVEDVYGNLYLAGGFEGTINLNPSGTGGQLTSTSHDIFLAKFDKDGSFIWAFSMGGYCVDQVISIVTDLSGNVIMEIAPCGTIDLNPSPSVADTIPDGTGIILAKYDKNGNYVWGFGLDAFSIGFLSNTKPEGIATDKNRNTLLTGIFLGKVDFDPSPLAADTAFMTAPLASVFIAKYDSLGNHVWSKALNAAGGGAIGIETGSDNSVVITGDFADSIDVNPSGAVKMFYNNPIDMTDGFVAKYDSNGNFVWANQLVNTMGYTDLAAAVSIDDNNDVYVSGHVDTTDVDPTANTYMVYYGIYMAKYSSSSGNLIWAKQVSNAGYIESSSYDKNGNIVLAGFFSDSILVNSNNKLISKGNTDILCINYDTAGTYNWAFGVGGSQADFARTIHTRGNLLLSGLFTDTVDFDPFSSGFPVMSNNPGTEDIFMAKYQLTSGIPELLANNSVILYPNPSNGVVFIKLSDYSSYKIEVFDAVGKRIKILNATGRETSVDLTGQPNGVYYINLSSEADFISRKVVVAK